MVSIEDSIGKNIQQAILDTAKAPIPANRDHLRKTATVMATLGGRPNRVTDSPHH